MKRSHVLQALRAAKAPVPVPTLRQQFNASAEAVYVALVSLEALKLARPVIAEPTPNRQQCIGWVPCR